MIFRGILHDERVVKMPRNKMPADEGYEYDISQNAAAKMIGVAVRTLGRMAARGEVERDPDSGLYSTKNLEEWMQARDSAEGGDERDVIVKELTEGYKQATDHAERLLKLIEGPSEHILSTLERINAGLMKHLEEQNEKHLENLKMLGEMFLQKDERAAILRESELKAARANELMKLLREQIPRLGEQAGAKAKKVKDFFSALTPDEQDGIAGLANYMSSPEKRELFVNMLKEFGIKAPDAPKEENAL